MSTFYQGRASAKQVYCAVHYKIFDFQLLEKHACTKNETNSCNADWVLLLSDEKFPKVEYYFFPAFFDSSVLLRRKFLIEDRRVARLIVSSLHTVVAVSGAGSSFSSMGTMNVWALFFCTCFLQWLTQNESRLTNILTDAPSRRRLLHTGHRMQ